MENGSAKELAPEASIVRTIVESDLADLSGDIGETLLDQLLEEGFARDLPIVNSLVGVVRAGLTIRDYLFLKKTLLFLYQLKRVPPDKRRHFSEKLEKSDEFREKVGNNLILLLHRLDDMEKPKILGRFFKAFVDGRIDHQTYEKLAVALDRIKIQSLPGLVEFYGNYDGNNYDQLMDHPTLAHDVIQDLILCGLIDIRFMPGIMINGVNLDSGVTQLGKQFVEIVLEETSMS